MGRFDSDPAAPISAAWLQKHLTSALLERAAAMNVPAAREALALPPLYEKLNEWKQRVLKEPAKPTTELDPIPGDPCPACWKGIIKDIVPDLEPIYTVNANTDYALVNFTVQCPECQWLMNGRTHRREEICGPQKLYERSFTTEQPMPIVQRPVANSPPKAESLVDQYLPEQLDETLLTEAKAIKERLSPDRLERAAAMNVVAARVALGLPPLYDPRFIFNRDKWAAGGCKPTTKLDPIPGDPCPQCWAAELVDPKCQEGPYYSPNGDADWAQVRFDVLCPSCQWTTEGLDYYTVDLNTGGSEYVRAFKTRPIAEVPNTGREQASDLQRGQTETAAKVGYWREPRGAVVSGWFSRFTLALQLVFLFLLEVLAFSCMALGLVLLVCAFYQLLTKN